MAQELWPAVGFGRYATRVRVRTPQGSAFDGQTGVVVRIHHEGAIEIRLGAGRYVGQRRIFGRSELEVLR